MCSAEENFFCLNFFLDEMSVKLMQETDLVELVMGIFAVSYRNCWIEQEQPLKPAELEQDTVGTD